VKAAVIVIALLVAGLLVWNRLYSRSARIEAAYKACMKQIGAADEQTKAAIDKEAATRKSGGPAAAMVDGLAKGVGQAMSSMVQGVGSAICGAMRDTCRQDFDGRLCRAALAQYR
jgi:hypothetical protein